MCEFTLKILAKETFKLNYTLSMRMKKIAIVLCCFMMLSCSKSSEAVFDIDIETFFSIPAGLNSIDTHYFIVRDVPTRINAINPNATSDNISSVKANRGRLSGRFQNIDYRFVDRIAITAISQSDPDFRREIFWMDFIPLDQSGDLELFSSLPEVKDILLEELIDLEIRLTFRTFTPTTIDSRIFLNFKGFVE